MGDKLLGIKSWKIVAVGKELTPFLCRPPLAPPPRALPFKGVSCSGQVAAAIQARVSPGGVGAPRPNCGADCLKLCGGRAVAVARGGRVFGSTRIPDDPTLGMGQGFVRPVRDAHQGFASGMT